MGDVKQLLIWNVPERESMLSTIRHEGFHQSLDRISGEAPDWLHEGMAESIEEAVLVPGLLALVEYVVGRAPMARSILLIPTAPSSSIRLHSVSQGAGQTRPHTDGKGLVSV